MVNGEQGTGPQGASADAAPWLGPLVAVIAVACGASPFVHGFYAFSVWGAIALGMLALVWGLALGGYLILGRLALVALAGLVTLALVSSLSVDWADAADRARVEAARWILYSAAFGVFLAAVRTDRIARFAMAGAAAGIGIVGVYILARMVGGSGASLFVSGRLYGPLGYVNSQGLFLVLGLWPLLALAEHARPALAGPAAAWATTLAALATLSQARGVAFAFVASTLAVMLLGPGRLRRVWLLVLMIAGVAAVAPPLFDVYDKGRAGEPGFQHAVQTAGIWILVAAAGVGLAWGALVAARPRLPATARRASVVALCVVAIAGAGVVVTRADSIANHVSDQVRAFTHLQPSAGRSRLISGGGNRYEYWRIAAREFSHHVIAGVGAGNYTRDYFIQRRIAEDIRQPHSIEFQTLAELGLLGTVGLLLFVGAVAFGAIRRSRARAMAPPERILLVATVGVVAAWLAHSSVDWSFLFPGATGVALLAAAWLVAGHEREGAPVLPRLGRWGRFAAGAGIGVVIAVAAIAVGRPLLALHYLDDGKRALSKQPVQAIENANDSLAFSPGSVDALYLRSAGFARLGDYGGARGALLEATRLEPHNFLPWAGLGDLAVRRGDLAGARRLYTRAWRLNPRDRALAALRRNPRP